MFADKLHFELLYFHKKCHFPDKIIKLCLIHVVPPFNIIIIPVKIKMYINRLRIPVGILTSLYVIGKQTKVHAKSEIKGQHVKAYLKSLRKLRFLALIYKEICFIYSPDSMRQCQLPSLNRPYFFRFPPLHFGSLGKRPLFTILL